jgi:hypothetical protein
MNGKNRHAIAKLAGSIGLAGFGSIVALPAMAQSSALNPNPTILSEAPYNRLAQASPGLESGTTPSADVPRNSTPSLSKVNPNPSIFSEAPYNRASASSTLSPSLPSSDHARIFGSAFR